VCVCVVCLTITLQEAEKQRLLAERAAQQEVGGGCTAAALGFYSDGCSSQGFGSAAHGSGGVNLTYYSDWGVA